MPNIVPQEAIEAKILWIRGKKVMLDRHLGQLYGVKAIALRQQVKRNKKRFPDDFMFQLSKEEADFLVSQNVIPSQKSYGGSLPYAFTEQGIAMLSSVLNSERAIEVNIAIMRAFVKMRQLLEKHKGLLRKIEEMEKKYDYQFRVVFEAIRNIIKEEEKPGRRIGFRTD